ncbi:polymorphic toxin-type HINT domain-containing protein [Nonomuraea dietziae]|uniref:polymorphic toxin-type HINT domain-containing protein n=1 Tax=Nonomuraea dietziae TaxID=65515 RepID=UPI0031D7B280
MESSGQLASGLWTYSNVTPQFWAWVADPANRYVGLGVEVEHDPSAAGQGSGLIWADQTAGNSGRGTATAYSPSVPSGKLQDGWLIRWRVRGLASDYSDMSSSVVPGPWSEWQTGKIDTSKPTVSEVESSGQLASGLWTYSNVTPQFWAWVADPANRYVGLGVEVEHDPSAAGQGSGLIWADQTAGNSGRGTATAYSPSVPSGKLQDGWLIRWRVRGLASDYSDMSSSVVPGPWSEWQTSKVEVGKPAGTGLGVLPATQGSGTWTLSSVTPSFYMKVIAANGAASYLGAEIERDPAAGQGTGLIWAGQGSTSYASGSNAWVQVPTNKLTDGLAIRWRVRGVTTAGTKGVWSDWQIAQVDLKKPSVAGLGMTPATNGTGIWAVSSMTPWAYAKVTDPESRASFLNVEVEHDPSAGGQGSGLIWAGTGPTSYNSGSNAWVQVPPGKLSDGWLVRWRARGQTTTGVKGPWSDWQSARVNLKRPSVEGLGMDPAVRSTASWTAATLTPWLYATVTDPENRASYLGIEVEHDPSVNEQGSGQIYAGTATTSYATGTKAWMAVPPDTLQDGWLIRWRVRGVTTSGVTGAWSDWQFAKVSALPFETFSPANNTQVGTLTPTLSAHARPLSEAPVTYWFQVCAGTKPNWTWCESSPDWVKSGAWTVPEKKLKWGETYSWFAKAATSTTTVTSSWRTFTPTPEQGGINSLLASSSGGQEFDHSSGNYTHTETDISVAAVGLPLSVSRTYNSLDPRTDGAFGAGWSTRWDMRVTPEPQTSTLLVTYPAGEQLRFAAKSDGTYASPPGTYATLVKLPEGGWRLMDKSSTSYWFDTAGQLTKITDARNRGQQLAYGADGKLSKVTATGDRSLTFTWTGNHVTSVSTDPVNGAAITWTYAYEGDKLVKACPPISNGACTTYTYGDASRYRSLVTDAAPQGYWRLNETTPATGTKIANSAGWNIATEDAKLTGATADLTVGVTGALSGSTDPAMRFKGTATSTYVSLPQATVSGQGNTLAVEAWFKTTGSGTVLGYQNSATNTPSAFTPMVYVGTDGKLRGQFYNGKSAPITSSTVVNDGAWHHVVLSGAEDTQTLYLDGQAVGTLAGTITHVDQWETRIGSGFGSSAWPATTGSTAPFPFAGDIDEVAVYGKPLGLALVRAHYAARLAQPQMTKVVRPSGKVWAENSYAADGGRLSAHTDSNGGTWKISTPVYAKETTLYTSATVTVTGPNQAPVVYIHDASRGNRLVSRTDQLGQTTKYAYDTGGNPAKVVDRNGNAVELSYNARGNLIAKKTCRSADICSTEYFDYHLNVDDPFDPRNDQVVTTRDGRSASATDDTYASTVSYNSFGEMVKTTTPATTDFPQGNTATRTYTDGSEEAVGGGRVPAGLVATLINPRGDTIRYRYTAAGDVVEELTQSGLKVSNEYDALGRVVSRTETSSSQPAGVVTTITYNSVGQVETQTATGVKNEITGVTHTAQQRYTYDADGRPLSEAMVDLTGGDAEKKIVYTYDAFGRTETVTGPEGETVRYTWDQTGAQTSVTDAAGATITTAYTKRGEAASRTLKGWTGSPLAPQPAQDVVVESFAYDPEGRLASRVDAMGRKTSYTYYADNLLVQTIADDAKLNGTSTPQDLLLEERAYDAAGNMTKQVTGGGKNTTTFTYDAAKRLTSQTLDPAGLARKSTFGYDANGQVINVTRTAAGTARKESTSIIYNAAGQVTRQTVENGADDLVSTMSYDEHGFLTEMTDPRGNADEANKADFTTSMRYDSAGRLIEVRAPQVKVDKDGATTTARPTTRFGYDTVGDQTHVIDAEGRTTVTAYDRGGRVKSVTASSYTAPATQTVLKPQVMYTYDAAGRVKQTTDARGNVTGYEYDVLGRQVRVSGPAPQGQSAGRWMYEYDLLGELLATVDPMGARTQATYDDLGRQVSVTQIERAPAASYTTLLEYTDSDVLAKKTAPNGQITMFASNPAGEVVKQTDPLGNVTSADFDLSGRLLKVTNPLGNSTESVYDLAGRLTKTNDLDDNGAILRSLSADYDAAGNPTSVTSAEGHTTRKAFDALSRVTSLIEPISDQDSITTTFGYDATGKATRRTDGRGNTTWTSYNSLGLPETVVEPATSAHPHLTDRSWTSSYDAAGNLLTLQQPGGVRIDRTYDADNNLIKETGTGAEVATADRLFDYDLAGKPTVIGDRGIEYNDRGNPIKITRGGVLETSYGYDALGNITQRNDASGNATFTYDDASRLATAVDPLTNRTLTYQYDKNSRLTSLSATGQASTQSFDYDWLDRLTEHTLKNASGAEISKIAYGWNKDDHLTSKTTIGLAGAGANTYGYDHAGRLTSWTGPDGATTSYAWDAAGNRVKAGDKNYTYDERNRLTSANGTQYTYTPRGTVATQAKDGLTRGLLFDAFDQLIRDGDTTFAYDALGRTATRSVGQNQQTFLYSGLGNDLAAITDATGAAQSSYSRDLNGGLFSLKEGAASAAAVLSDLHGDVVATFTLDALRDSVSYDPFGKVIAQTGTKPSLGYQGEYTDPESGKVNMLARWYEPDTAAFTSRDSWTLDPYPSIQANRYTYANGNPLTGVDPTGHYTCFGSGCYSGGGGSLVTDDPCASGGCWLPGSGLTFGGVDSLDMSGPEAVEWQAANGHLDGPGLNEEERERWGGQYTASGQFLNEKSRKKYEALPGNARLAYDRAVHYMGDVALYEFLDYLYAHNAQRKKTNGNASSSGAGGYAGGPDLPDTRTYRDPCVKDQASLACKSARFKYALNKHLANDKKLKQALQELVKAVAEATDLKQDIDNAIKCLNSGDAGACIETAITVLTSSVGGALVKRGLSFVFNWAKKVEQFKKVFDIGKKVVAKLNAWFDSRAHRAQAKRELDTAIAACKKNSFAPITPVRMADGTFKPIEEIQIGDQVLATDPETGKAEAKPVVALIVGNGAKNLVDITVDTDGSGGSETGVIVATDNHPFWVPVLAEWKDAITLEPGQWLQTSAGANVQITAVTRRLPLNERVHNLTIADLHTYHVGVGAVDALVHNEVCDAAWGGALHIQEEWQKGNRNHGIPGVDMRNVDQIAEYLDGILTGAGWP